MSFTESTDPFPGRVQFFEHHAKWLCQRHLQTVEAKEAGESAGNFSVPHMLPAGKVVVRLPLRPLSSLETWTLDPARKGSDSAMLTNVTMRKSPRRGGKAQWYGRTVQCCP